MNLKRKGIHQARNHHKKILSLVAILFTSAGGGTKSSFVRIILAVGLDHMGGNRGVRRMSFPITRILMEWNTFKQKQTVKLNVKLIHLSMFLPACA